MNVNYWEIKQELNRSGGLNLNKDGEIVYINAGYMVALPNYEIVCDVKNVDAVTQSINHHLDLIQDAGLYVGLWLNTENNKLYIDLSSNYDTLHDATKAGKAFNQLAIYDCLRKKEIRL